MNPLVILAIFLFFNALGRFISPQNRGRYRRRDGYSDFVFQPRFMPPNIEEKQERDALSYTLIFVALLAIAMYLAHDFLQSDVKIVVE